MMSEPCLKATMRHPSGSSLSVISIRPVPEPALIQGASRHADDAIVLLIYAVNLQLEINKRVWKAFSTRDRFWFDLDHLPQSNP